MNPIPEAPERATLEHRGGDTASGDARERVAPSAGVGSISIWSDIRGWMAENSFPSLLAPAPLRSPIAGYALAVALELVAALLTIILVIASPTFSFFGMLNILVVVIVALSWGAAPGMLATLTSAVVLETLVLPMTTHGGLTRIGDLVEIAVCLVVGAFISIFASSAERARRRAVTDHMAAQARELALSEMNARTDEFLSIASHELRSPLTSLKAAVQLAQRRLRLLIDREPLPDDLPNQFAITLGLLATAAHQVDRQDRLVGDLLDVSRIRANRLEFHLAACDLASIVRDTVDEQRLSWPDRTITLDAPDAPTLVEADAHRIGQVVTNFLTNALKYSPPDAPVAVSLHIDGAQARVAVRDSGPGLTVAQQAHIWERFHRVPGIMQQSGSGAGLGLGLHISRTIIEQHSGRIGIESTPKKGSTFWFTLPVIQPPSAR